MIHIRNREDLINILCDVPRPAISRAALCGDVEIYGFFKQISDTDKRQAWIFEVRGLKKKWIVAVTLQRKEAKYRVLRSVPWKWWDGNHHSLRGGDHSWRYATKRIIWSKQ